ncbi:MAG TPA: hypothetical protein VKL61_06590, partial [Candidatus Polarisedimenticolia bacterium]|nr:hypothetical protein [Candidatus Polarisedimenticolia bacterium]
DSLELAEPLPPKLFLELKDEPLHRRPLELQPELIDPAAQDFPDLGRCPLESDQPRLPKGSRG